MTAVGVSGLRRASARTVASASEGGVPATVVAEHHDTWGVIRRSWRNGRCRR